MFPLLPSNPSDPLLVQKAQALAEQWHLQYCTASSEAYYLQLTPQRLQLISQEQLFGPIFIDFTSGAVEHRRKFGGGKGQTIAKAIGFHKIPAPIILDATAGMGKDAFVFASLDARVILMERSPVSAALLCNALERALSDENSHKDIKEIVQRMTFKFGDAQKLSKEIIKNWPEQPDVVYLDPMFPHRKKSAQVKKEMLALQKIIGDDTDSNQLLETALQIARKRVVVKRPIKAPYLNQQPPTYTLKMKKHRFDIYIIPAPALTER